MARKTLSTIGISWCLILMGLAHAEARNLDGIRPVGPPPSGAAPAYCNTYHNVGRMALGVSNDGTFATSLSVGGSTRDCFTNDALPTCEYPINSRTTYCFGGALWIGAVLGRDTLVSTAADGWTAGGNEFHPDEPPFGNMIYRSTIDPAKPEFEGAVSEQDYIARYADTCRNCNGVLPDPADARAHRPLNIEVTQRTYAWSYSYAQDFVLFDYAIKNIGATRLRRVFMGIYVDADIHDLAIQGTNGAQDDLNGFRKMQPALYLKPPCPPDSDEVNIAWTADNDGELGQLVYQTVPNITATRIVRTPSDSLEVSFNWWVSNANAALDYGPMRRANQRDYMTGGSGTPRGDRNKFFILSNGDFDFDQARCAVISTLDSVWIPPPQDRASIWATGLDTRYVLSFGPFDIEPGQSLPISLAYVGGVQFHQSSQNFANLPHNPDGWYEGVNWDSLGSSATWAEWVYDNPGVDTDSDGYAGEFTVCDLAGNATFEIDTTWDSTQIPPVPIRFDTTWHYTLSDTVWRKGDGVPDFRGATPPPAPCTYSTTDANGRRVNGLRVESGVGHLTIKWNGVLCENTADVFSRELDFEGYRVYIGRDERASSYSVVASYDIEDYNRWDYNTERDIWELNESPFTLRELRCMYAPDSCDDANWNPSEYVRNRPLIIDPVPGVDTLIHIYYFEPQDFNQSILGNYPDAQTGVRKVYPTAPRPTVLIPDSIRVLYPDGADTLYLTEDGFIKFYEYEFEIGDWLPTVPYWVDVTVFDYGSPQSGLDALETSPTLCPEVIYPLDAPDSDNRDATKVFVWPNPYRLDADYRGHGFEGRGEADRPDDRVRLIHFGNLPERCTISIYSLDGDLVREFVHPNIAPPPGCPTTLHEDCWELITRNSQQVVSGLYYWTVEDEAGNIQMGKLAIIM